MGEILQNWICLILFRLALPLTLLIATVVRFNLFSFIYGCLLLISPLLKRPTPKSLQSHTGRFIVATLVLCSLTLLSQVIFQIYISTGDRGIGNCSETEMILHHIGLQRLSSNVLTSATIVVPDIAAFIVSLVVFICCHTLLRQRPLPHISVPPFASHRWPARSCPAIFDYLAKFSSLVFMTLAGILQPSAIGSVYFVSVLLSVTVWSVFVHLHPHWFQGLRLFLLVYSALHLIAAYVVQFHHAQTIWTQHVEQNGTFERLFGLTRFIDVNCTNDSVISVRLDLPWATIVNIFVVIFFYFILAWELRRCRTKSPGKGKLKQEPESRRAVDEGQGVCSDPTVSFSMIKTDSSDLGSVVIPPDTYLDDAEEGQRRGVMITVGLYIMKQSYIGTLIIMMAWSIAYHSWLTFIFLLGACFIWILPQKQAVCLRFSPLIVLYAICLLVLQYLYAFYLTDEELPIKMSNNYKLDEVGLVKYENPAIPLGVKIGFTCMFWLTLRQFSWQRHLRKKARPTAAIPLTPMPDRGGSKDGETIKAIGRWLWHKLCKYWILACAALFLLIALREAVIFRIIYMALFLCFVITFQVSYRFWRLCIKGFWWLVILYSMVVLGCIYTYQFEGFPGLWQNNTGMSEEMLSNLGLRKFDTTMLFVQLLTPTSFLIVIIMQLHYFQKTFFFISDLNRFQKKDSTSTVQQDTGAEVEQCIPAKDISVDNHGITRKSVIRRGDSRRRHGVVNYSWKRRFQVVTVYIWQRLLNFSDKLSVVLWRFMEIHMFKFVVITIFLCCVLEVNVLNTVLLIIIIVLLPFEQTHHAVSVISLVWSSILLLLKMVYQLDTIPLDLMVSNCTLSSPPEFPVQFNETENVSQSTDGTPLFPVKLDYPFNLTIDSSGFVGLQRRSHLGRYIMIYIIVILMLVLEAIVKYHQMQFYNHPDRKRPVPGIMFEEIKRRDADRGVKEFFMFLANYTFYKFGKELCFTMTMITMVVRLDVFSVLYGIFLGILLLLQRRSCQSIWPVYVAILTVLLLIQYLSCLGMPPAICWEYPWNSHEAMTSNLKTYLFLPSYRYSPRAHKLIADFFQLLLVCLQWKVFCIESDDKKRRDFGGGTNYSIIREVEMGRRNPHENDFTSYKNSYLDYLKMVVFFWSFWLTLMIVLISGMSHISLFCMGYLIGCFVFLWFGEEMLLKPLRKLVKMWMGLLFYCYVVLLAKCCLQLVGCIYATKINPSFCWLIQLLNIVCLQSTYYKQPEWPKTDCQVSMEEAGLSWDAVCFVFLLFMVRVFKSWYFQHVVAELLVRNQLAARGAELINQNLIEEVEKLRLQEDEVLQRIKRKMEKIKERHQRCVKRKAQSVVEPDDHYLVIRSGDYYMFEDMTDEEEEELEGVDGVDGREGHADIIDESTETPDWRAKKPAIGPIAIINAALLGGTKEALNLAGGRSSMFSTQMSRRSSSSREYGTPDFEPPPSSPIVTTHTQPSKEFSSFADVPTGTPHQPSRRPEPVTSTPTAQSTSISDFRDSKVSPRKAGIRGPSEGISPVAEEVISVGEDDVFDRKMEAPEDVEQSEKQEDAVVSGLSFIRVFAISLLDSLTAFLYNLSRKYRSISRVLDREKQQEKLRRKPATASMMLRISENDQYDVIDSGAPVGAFRSSNILRQKASQKRFEQHIVALKSAEKDFHSQMPRLVRLTIAIMEALMSRTDLLCYFVMVLNVLLSASVLSILFPISVFFWGMLSVPRPTKTYWISVITYTEAIIVVKYLFQFNFFPWNRQHITNPPVFWLPRLLGIEKKEMYAALDFLLLFCLFLHRMVLKGHGLWKDAKAQDADLKDVELKRCSLPGSPQSSQLREDTDVTMTASVESRKQRNTASASPKPSHEDIVTDAGGDMMLGEEGGGKGVGSEEITLVLEEADEEEEPKKENRSRQLCLKLFEPVYDFFCHIVCPKYSAVSDVYAFMFACDLVTFLIVVFGYSSFGPASVEGADVATVLQQSRVPVPFLAMLLVQFVLFIIDRALYLRRLVFGKFLFHIFLVLLVHIWMFFLLPAITDRAFTTNMAAQLWYFIKCIYFALSCYQIRSGYPTRILGNFLTKNYNYLNLFCFKGFLAVPFLLELRALMDWMWTDTTLALTSWLQMEDIYANIFVLKCWRRAEKKYPTPRGLPRSPVVKYGLGGLILVILVFIIWFPLLLFSLSGSIFNANPPVAVDLEIKISGYQSIFSVTAQYQDIEKLTRRQFDELKKQYSEDARAQAFLMSYHDEDVYKVRIPGTSTSTWEISHPSERHLHDTLANSDRITFLTVITVRREPTTNSVSVPVPTVVGTFETTLNRSNPEQKQIMQTLAKMIDGSYHLNVTIPYMFPRYVTVPSQKRLNESGALFGQNLSWSSVLLSLHQHPVRKTRWWQVEEYVSGNMSKQRDLGNGNDATGVTLHSYNPYLTIVTFNERVPTGVFSVLNNYGIIGIYVSVVLVLGKFVRLWTQGLMMRIIFEELPNPEPIWTLSNNIYLAREASEYQLEEELVSKLIFIFRSPELLVRITNAKLVKQKQE